MFYKKQGVVCLKCGTYQSQQNQYCITCGEKIGDTCKECGTHLHKNEIYCSQCGKRVKEKH